jgi:hypothetical protein
MATPSLWEVVTVGSLTLGLWLIVTYWGLPGIAALFLLVTAIFLILASMPRS